MAIKLRLPPPPKRRISCVTQEKESEKKSLVGVGQLTSAMIPTILQKASSNPIEAAQLAQSGLRQLENLSDSLALLYCKIAYVSAASIRMNGHQWVKFTAHKYWKAHKGHKPKANDHTKCLRWMLVFVFRAESEKAKDNARMYTGALQNAFDSQMDVNELDEYLKIGGGVDMLFRKRSKLEKQKKIEAAQEIQAQNASEESATPAEVDVGDQQPDNNEAQLAAHIKEDGLGQPPRELIPTCMIPLRGSIEQLKAIYQRGGTPIILEATTGDLAALDVAVAKRGITMLEVKALARASTHYVAQGLKVKIKA